MTKRKNKTYPKVSNLVYGTAGILPLASGFIVGATTGIGVLPLLAGSAIGVVSVYKLTEYERTPKKTKKKFK